MTGNLFEFDGINISINPMLLSIKEFEKIWKRDKSKDKSKARKELTYVYAMVSNDNDNIWKDYADLKQREQIIIDDLFKNDWMPDRVVNEALDKYKQRYPKTPTEMLLETLMKAMLKIKTHIDDIDLNERDTQGRTIHNPKMIFDISTLAIKKYMEIEDVIDKIHNNKQIMNDKLRGGAEEGFFEDENITEDLI